MVRLVALLPLLCACEADTGKPDEEDEDGGATADAVVVEGVEAFGDIASAIWLRRGSTESLWVANVPELCARYDAVLDAAAEWSTAQEEASEETYCADVWPAFEAYADAYRGVVYPGAHHLQVLPLDVAAFAEGSFAVGEEASVSLVYVEDDYWAAVLAEWDTNATAAEDCGLTSEQDSPSWRLTSGELVVHEVGAAAVRFEADGTIDDLPDGPGSVTAAAEASLCE